MSKPLPSDSNSMRLERDDLNNWWVTDTTGRHRHRPSISCLSQEIINLQQKLQEVKDECQKLKLRLKQR